MPNANTTTTATPAKKSSKPRSAKKVNITLDSAPATNEAAPVKVKKTRNRRNPVNLLADLEAQREKLADSMAKRLSNFDTKIEKIRAKNVDRLAIAELTAGKTHEELNEQFAALKRQQQLLRKAVKVSSAG